MADDEIAKAVVDSRNRDARLAHHHIKVFVDQWEDSLAETELDCLYMAAEMLKDLAEDPKGERREHD